MVGCLLGGDHPLAGGDLAVDARLLARVGRVAPLLALPQAGEPGALAFLGCALAHVGRLLTIIGEAVALIGLTLAFVGDAISAVGHPVARVGVTLAFGDGSFAVLELTVVGLRIGAT
jgi:hypothetical protein